MVNRCRQILFLLIVVVGFPQFSLAQGTNITCADAEFLFLGQSAKGTIPATEANLYYKFQVLHGRSYAVMAWAPYQPDATLRAFAYTAADCQTEVIGTGPGVSDEVVRGTRHSGGFSSFIATSDGTVHVRIQNFRPATEVHVLAMETTLVSPWWFSGGTNQSYIVIRSNAGATSSFPVRVSIFDSNGLACATLDVRIPFNGNAVFGIKELVECAHVLSGSVTLTFLGVPGAFTANTTTIDVVNGTSFDTPFAPRLPIGPFSR